MNPISEELKKQNIIDQLRWDDSIDENEILVSISNGTVQLKGSVPNYASKLAAERNAIQVTGVKQVENYLEIEFPPHDTLPSDSEITENIIKMLILDSRILSKDITIETVNGMVSKSGKVNHFWEKYAAQSIISNAKGVVDVNNQLRVILPKSLVDVNIENELKNAYQRNILIDEDRINVSVANGIAHLTGNVTNYLIKKEAINIAMHTKGVLDVVDEITI